MKKILFLIIILFAKADTYGKTISAGDAKIVGYNFLLKHDLLINSTNELTLVYSEGDPDPYFYVFTTNFCYVVVAANDVSIPILGYSLNKQFHVEKLPDGLKFMFDIYGRQIKYAINHSTQTPENTTNKWVMLQTNENHNSKHKITSGPVVCPLLNSEWSQEGGYNLYCPGSQPTGCVATAMAQVMNYWQWPSYGVGWKEYFNTWTSDLISSDFSSHPFQWTDMVPSLYPDPYVPAPYYPCPARSFPGTTYPAYLPASKAISNLGYQAGISANMQYDFLYSSESFAWPVDAALALTTNFLYNANFSDRYITWIIDEAPWLNYINSNLNSGQPVIYAGIGGSGAHCWVIDGYDADGFYNMNWGWQGLDEGIFTLNHITPPGMGEYDWIEQAILDIYPYCPGDIVTYANSSDITPAGGYTHGGILMGSSLGGSGLMTNNSGVNEWFTAQFIDVQNNFMASEIAGSAHYFELTPHNCGSPHRATFDTIHALSIQPGNPGNIIQNTVANIEIPPSNHSIRIFPNPAQDILTIVYSSFGSGDLDISIKDVAGRTVYNERFFVGANESDLRHQINISSLTPGVYNIDITQNEQHVVKKIVKLN